jgi:hypothetical protein
MDDTLGRNFFLQPTQTRHRHYEALRAVIIDQRPVPEVAQRFGYRSGTLRNLLSRFRAQCRGGQVPPFSPNPSTGDHGAPNRLPSRIIPTRRTAASSP